MIRLTRSVRFEWTILWSIEMIVSGAEREHDLSNVLLRHEGGLRIGDLFERKSFGHDGRYAPALDVFDQIGEHPGLQDRAAEQAQILKI